MNGEEADPVAWLRRRIEERLYLARHAIELGNNAVWVEQSSGVLVTGEPTESDAWAGTWPTGDSSLTRLMEANDPQDTIARCEAELAILDEHYILRSGDTNPAYEQYSVIEPPLPSKGCGCVTCHYGSQGGVHGYGICRTVRFLCGAYRFRSGYDEKWGITPAGTAPGP